MSVQIFGADGNTLLVNTAGEAKVSPTLVANEAGIIVAGGESGVSGDPGGRLVRPLEATQDYRLRVNSEQLEYFRYFAIAYPPETWHAVSTMTRNVAGSGSGYVMNNNGSVSNSAYNWMKTYRTFDVFIAGTTSAEFVLRWSAKALNQEWYFGLIQGTSVTTPNDGIYFKRDDQMDLRCVVNNNGSETLSTVIDETALGIVDNKRHHFQIVVGTKSADFYINYILVATVDYPIESGMGFAYSQKYKLTAGMRNLAAGTVSTSVTINLFAWGVTYLDYNRQKPWGHILAGNERVYPTEPSGNITGHVAHQFTNSSAWFSGPLSLSNTTPMIALLGLSGYFNAVAGAGTDYAVLGHLINGYAEPAGVSDSMASNFYCTGLKIFCAVRGAVIAVTPTYLVWMLGTGSTAASLATVDGTNTRNIKRMPVGTMVFKVGDAVDTSQVIEIKFDQPQFVPAGCYLHVILKIPIGTATASQTFYFDVWPQGYYD